jgi:hypothetical protein
VRATRLIAFATSTLLHLALLAPAVWVLQAIEAPPAAPEVDAAEGPAEDAGHDPVAAAPVKVTLYTDPAEAAVPVVAPSDAAPLLATGPALVIEPPPAPPAAPPPAPSAAEPAPAVAAVATQADAIQEGTASSEPVPEPPPVEPPPIAPPPAEPPPEPVADVPVDAPVSDADRAALAAIERGDESEGAPTTDDQGEAHEDHPVRGMRRVHRRAGHADHRPPCPPPTPSIARAGESRWAIQRDLIEYYATHLVELQKLGSVWTHHAPTGELDGFRVGLSRCSVLRQGGLRSGDVVHDINGHRINTVLQAVGAYIALRRETELAVTVTRRGRPVVLSYAIEAPKRGPRVARAGDAKRK